MKTVFVTGATRGIGHATAKRLLARGHHVIALGRNFSDFDLDKSSASGRCERIVFDLRSIDDISMMCALLPPIDVLVNNAAMLTAQQFESYTPKDRRDVIATNIEAPAELIRCLVPKMIAAGSLDAIKGRVINLASVAGFGVIPTFGTARAKVRF